MILRGNDRQWRIIDFRQAHFCHGELDILTINASTIFKPAYRDNEYCLAYA